jgi:hypothetical protein
MWTYYNKKDSTNTCICCGLGTICRSCIHIQLERMMMSVILFARTSTVVSKKSEVGLVHFCTLLQSCTFYV